MREICTSGSVGGEGGNILTYPATTGRMAGNGPASQLYEPWLWIPGSARYARGPGMTKSGFVTQDCYQPFHWALILASLITRPHLSISARRKVSSSSGVEPITMAPLCSSLALSTGFDSAAILSS